MTRREKNYCIKSKMEIVILYIICPCKSDYIIYILVCLELKIIIIKMSIRAFRSFLCILV